MDPSAVSPPDEAEVRGEKPSALHHQPYRQIQSNNPFRRHPPQHISPSTIWNSAHSATSLQLDQTPAPLERHVSLGDYFSIDEVPRTSYSDTEFKSISRLLGETGRGAWSQIPRIYTVLRCIGQIPKIEAFLDQGMNDMWLPFEASQLPHMLTADEKRRFIETQGMVLTKALDLENTSVKKHAHFKKGEELPLTIGDRLGKGGYGNVFSAYSPLSGRTYALKLFRRSKAERREVQSFMNELQILKRINHHHCVDLVASYTDSKNFGLLISPVADCNLAEFYSIAANSETHRDALRTFFGCMAHALQYLHNSKIRHRDIKPENILVKDLEVYLTDFGISLDWESLSRSTTTADSAKSWIYCAPEVAEYEKRNSSSDVWSLGCVFLEMLTVLEGYLVEDLRVRMRANSGRPRFYENHDVAMGWAESIGGEGSACQNALSWIRGMMIVEPTLRVSCLTLCSLIAASGRRKEREEKAIVLCGDCCLQDHSGESSSDAGSDGAWAEDFSPASITPTTSPPVTNDVLKSKQASPPSQTSGIIPESSSDPAQLKTEGSILGSSEAAKDASTAGCDEETTLTGPKRCEEVAEPSSSGSLVPITSRTRSEQVGSTELRKSLEASSIITSMMDAPSTLNLATHESASDSQLQGTDSRKEPVAGSNDTKVRQKILERLTRVWPSIDLRNKIPNIPLAAWKTPQLFLTAIQSDASFMNYLNSIDASHMQRFKEATIDDMFPMIHLLLLGGLNANAGYSVVRKALSSRNEEKPLLRTLQPHWSQINNHQHIARLLLGFGASVNVVDSNFNSPLTLACIYGYMDLAKELLEIDPELVSKDSAIEFVCKWGNVQMVELLVKKRGSSKFHWSQGCAAARRGDLDVIKVLLENGFDVNEGMTSGGRTMLHTAIEDNHVEIVKYLLAQGADPTHRGLGDVLTRNSGTALRLARKTKNEELTKIINEATTAWKDKEKDRDKEKEKAKERDEADTTK